MLNNSVNESPEAIIQAIQEDEIKRDCLYIVANGRVGCATRDSEGNVDKWEVEQYPFGHEPESSVGNVLHEINQLLEIVKQDGSFNNNHILVIAVHESVLRAISSLEIMTKQVMFQKGFKSFSKKSVEQQPEINRWLTKPYNKALEEVYEKYLTNMVELLGKVVITDSKYVGTTKDPNWKGLKTLAFAALSGDTDEDEDEEEAPETPMPTSRFEEEEEEEEE